MNSLKNLGKALNREEQKQVSGGIRPQKDNSLPTNPFLCISGRQCSTDADCCFGEQCHLITYGYPKVCN